MPPDVMEPCICCEKPSTTPAELVRPGQAALCPECSKALVAANGGPLAPRERQADA